MQKNIFNIFVDQNAKVKIIKMMKENKSKKPFFRIYIAGGGCSGFRYNFVFDKKNEDDYFIKDENIIIDHMSAQYLYNAKLIFESNLYGEKFVIKNPNVKTTCGCGLSFSI